MPMPVKRSQKGDLRHDHFAYRPKGGGKRKKPVLGIFREELIHLFFSKYNHHEALAELRRMNRRGILDEFIGCLERLIRANKESRARLEGRCRHHMINRSNGGTNHIGNKLLLYLHREKLLHLLFGDKNQYQILSEMRRMNEGGALTQYVRRLERVVRAKENQRQLWWEKPQTHDIAVNVDIVP